MFARKDFIDASRKFVCIRIETFENKESEKKVRSLLGGKFVNTAFCVFDPNGKKRLSQPGRSPGALIGRQHKSDDDRIIKEMNRIAGKFQPKKLDQKAIGQDFETLRQALNVASADQRLLILQVSKNKKLSEIIRTISNDKQVVGKFHYDILNRSKDSNWKKVIRREESGSDVLIIKPSKFGLEGTVMAQLSDKTTLSQLREELLKANKTFSESEVRKKYQSHVISGVRNGIYFKNKIPYGEDRDGDGKIDNPIRRRRR